jgi:hypothetical protein
MAELTAPNSTSVGVTRLGRPAQAAADELGPLANLVGNWIGSKGYELIAVPLEEVDHTEGFRVILRPYTETLVFTPIGAPVPDRGGPAGDMFITGVLYQTRISDLETGEPLHLENGMFLNLGALGGDNPIARQASIPHGDVLLALGTAVTTPGPPQIPSPTGLPTNTGPKTGDGYLENYPRSLGDFYPSDPNKVLQDAIAGLEIVETTTLDLSTGNGGGIVNIPFVDANANATAFSSTFWIETVKAPNGNDVLQLQYSQQTNIEFIQQFGGPPGDLIMWPHVNVNTLSKQ